MIIHNHPPTQQQRQHKPTRPKRRRRNQRRQILRRILIQKDITTHHAHEIRNRHPHGRQHDPTIFIGNVIVVPDVEDDARGGSAPGHHEAGEVSNVEIAEDVDGGVDYEADEGEEEAGRDVGEADMGEIGSEGEDEEHDCACNVGGDGVEIGFDCRVLQAGNDYGEEELDGLQWDTETNLNSCDYQQSLESEYPELSNWLGV